MFLFSIQIIAFKIKANKKVFVNVITFFYCLTTLKTHLYTHFKKVKPVCLPKFATSSLQADESVYVSGYGSNTLQEIKMSTLSYDNCKNIYGTSLPNGGVFCAKPVTSGSDTCKVCIYKCKQKKVTNLNRLSY